MKKYVSTLSLAIAAMLAIPAFALAAIDMQLDRGESGAEVTELQSFLALYPSIYPEGLVTGYFGTLTQAAVERYQCERNIVCGGSPTTTGYGRVGPQTRAHMNAEMSGSGGVGGSVDKAAPLHSAETVVTTDNSATITWSTNEDSFGRVMYGLSWPFLYATAPSFGSAGFDTAHSVTLTGLAADTMYYFVREAVDASGNIQWTGVKTFTTK